METLVLTFTIFVFCSLCGDEKQCERYQTTPCAPPVTKRY